MLVKGQSCRSLVPKMVNPSSSVRKVHPDLGSFCMLFFNWWIVAEFIVAVVFVFAGIGGLKYARRLSRSAPRLATRVASLVFVLLGSMLGLLLWAASGCQSHSTPIYSPSGTMAVRVENSDGGATDGESFVVLYWAHGLRQQTIFWGPFGTVKVGDIRWINDSSVSIHYSTEFSGDSYHCYAAPAVSVDCSPRLLR